MLTGLLFIIFGWPRKWKTIGPAIGDGCPHCSNHSVFYLQKSRRWFELFWIPVLPLGRATYYLSCEICAMGWEIDRDAVANYKEMVQSVEAYSEGELNQDEYRERQVELLQNARSGDVEAVETDPQSRGTD